MTIHYAVIFLMSLPGSRRADADQIRPMVVLKLVRQGQAASKVQVMTSLAMAQHGGDSSKTFPPGFENADALGISPLACPPRANCRCQDQGVAASARSSWTSSSGLYLHTTRQSCEGSRKARGCVEYDASLIMEC